MLRHEKATYNVQLPLINKKRYDSKVGGTTQNTEAFEARKNWVLGCGGLILPICMSKR